MYSKETLGAYIEAGNFRPTGFDYLRLGLASAVALTHCYDVAYGHAGSVTLWKSIWARPIMSALLPMFFVLSGFLVAGSMQRSHTLLKFMGLRFLRIYPALIVEVILTALLIGPFVTVLTLGDYFSAPGFYRYLLNATGHITTAMPDAFVNNPRPEIANLQLWTVPSELACYVALGLLILVGAKRNRRIVVAGLVMAQIASVIHTGIETDWLFPESNGPLSGRYLVPSFLMGVCLYLYRFEVPNTPVLVLVSAVSAFVLFNLPYPGRALGCYCVAYLTVAVGVWNPRRTRLIDGADYSYGIYLYHYVILQTVMLAFGAALSWYMIALLSTPFIVCFAAFSWYVVERPALRLKLWLNPLEDKWTRLRLRFRASLPLVGNAFPTGPADQDVETGRPASVAVRYEASDRDSGAS